MTSCDHEWHETRKGIYYCSRCGCQFTEYSNRERSDEYPAETNVIHLIAFLLASLILVISLLHLV